jgi:hypothetical protein
MSDDEAKHKLRKLLRSYTTGRILHLLAQLSIERAKKERRNGNELLYQRLVLFEAGLIVAGYGADTACPE